MKLTFKNISENAYGVNALRGTLQMAPGETATEEFAPGEARAIKNNHAVFEIIDGYDESELATDYPGGSLTKDAGERDENGDTKEMAQMRRMFDTSYAQLGEKNAVLVRDLAAITAERDDLKNKLANVGGPGTGKMSLADAVASLDNKNDAHWTEGGKPDLDTLKGLTGNDSLKRADVDAVGIERKKA